MMFELQKLKIEIELIDCLLDEIRSESARYILFAIKHNKELELNKLNEMYNQGEYPDLTS